MAERRLDQFNAQGLANMTWAFAKAGQQDEQFFKALAKMAEHHLDQFNAQELANTAQSNIRVRRNRESVETGSNLRPKNIQKTSENAQKRMKNVRKSSVRKSAEKTPEVSATSRRSCGNAVAADAEKGEKNRQRQKISRSEIFWRREGLAEARSEKGKKNR